MNPSIPTQIDAYLSVVPHDSIIPGTIQDPLTSVIEPGDDETAYPLQLKLPAWPIPGDTLTICVMSPGRFAKSYTISMTEKLPDAGIKIGKTKM